MLKQDSTDKTLQLCLVLGVCIQIVGVGGYLYMDHVYNLDGFPDYYITKNTKLDCYSSSVELRCYSHDDRHVDPDEVSKTLNADEYLCSKVYRGGLFPGPPHISCVQV